MNRRVTISGVVFFAAVFLCSAASAQQKEGPLTAPPKREVTRIPVEKTSEVPPIPAEEIIRRFAEKEEEFLRARSAYGYRKTVRVQEFDENAKPTGEFQLVTEPAIGPNGRPYEKIVEQPMATLHHLRLAPEDLELIARMPLFPLATDQLSNYELTYQGKQPLDELTTYIFRVQPKRRERARAFFEGVVWVDERDLAIVKSYGKWVTEVGDVTAPELPFTTFEIYRENVDRRYWFPTYARSDDALKLKSGEMRLRLTIRWTDYKPPAGAPAIEAGKPAAPSAQPQPPQ